MIKFFDEINLMRQSPCREGYTNSYICNSLETFLKVHHLCSSVKFVFGDSETTEKRYLFPFLSNSVEFTLCGFSCIFDKL